MENNYAEIIGTATSDFIYDHTANGIKFYKFSLLINRRSGAQDELPVIVSEQIFDVGKPIKGKPISVFGEIRTFNVHFEDKSHLSVYIFCKKMFISNNSADSNRVFVDGYICKEPRYRSTPLGREISDFIIAVPRPYGKTDYIPTISWGYTARFISDCIVGSRVRIEGRLQSRLYNKKKDDGTIETKTSYELSADNLEMA